MAPLTMLHTWGLVLVDPQSTFVRSTGALATPEASNLCMKWADLLTTARGAGAPIVGLAQAPKDNEKQFTQEDSPHMVANTVNADDVLEAQLQGPVINTAHPSELSTGDQLNEIPQELILAMPAIDDWSDPGTKRVFETFRSQGVQSWAIAGVETDRSVKAVVLGLRSLDWPVYILTDAVDGGTEAKSADAFREMKEAGASLIESATALIRWKKQNVTS